MGPPVQAPTARRGSHQAAWSSPTRAPGALGLAVGQGQLCALGHLESPGPALQATRGPTARWTSTSAAPTLVTTGPARTASPPSPACAGPATPVTTARPTSMSATASPAATGAPARTATMPTSASASRGPQVPLWAEGGAPKDRGEELTACPPAQDPTVRSTWTTVPATPVTRAPVWTRSTVTSVRVSRATRVSRLEQDSRALSPALLTASPRLRVAGIGQVWGPCRRVGGPCHPNASLG